MKETKFRAWIQDYETEKYYMYHWCKDFFSDMSPVTGWWSDFPNPDSKEVILMQYVGKQDMNGNDIYEGDIIQKRIGQDCSDNIGIIEEDILRMGWIMQPINDEDRFFYNDRGINFDFHEIEIVGNIYENPDLIT